MFLKIHLIYFKSIIWTSLLQELFELIRLRVLRKCAIVKRDEKVLGCYNINIIKASFLHYRSCVPLDILCHNISCKMETLCEFAHIIYSTTYKTGGNNVGYIIFLLPGYIVLS